MLIVYALNHCSRFTEVIRFSHARPAVEPDIVNSMISRRTILLAPLAQVAARAAAAPGKMSLCLHQNTSSGAGYRKSLEGWSRAGIKYVELTAPLLDEFLKTDNEAAARRMVTDLGLTPVSCAAGLQDFWNPNPTRAASLEAWKKRC